jgi:hypothetical protein
VTANDNCDPAHVQWSRNLFAGLSDGGVWAVPRCGLLFTKRGNELHLTARMPHDPKMPISASELCENQDSTFGDVKAHFGAAGIAVVDKTPAPKDSRT